MNRRFDKTKTGKQSAEQTRMDDALDRALRQIGEEILDEPVPSTLLDALRKKETPPDEQGEHDDDNAKRKRRPPTSSEE